MLKIWKYAVPLLLLVAAGVIAVVAWHTPAPAKPVPLLSPAEFKAESAKLDLLMKQQGMTATINYVESKIASDPSFAKDCHPLTHALGHEAYEFYGGFEQAIKYQNEICDSGYTHGVVEEYLGKVTDINQALQTACSDTTATTFNQWQCYHGLGHGIMLVSAGNVAKSADLCKTVPATFDQEACINGVFMQHFVVTDHGGGLVPHASANLADCSYHQDLYQKDCYFYAPTAYLTLNSGKYTAAFKWCSGAQKAYVLQCVNGVGAQAMKDTINNVAGVKHICEAAPQAYRATCINGATGMYVFFHASSASAEPLCQGEFKAYQSSCRTAITDARTSLKI